MGMQLEELLDILTRTTANMSSFRRFAAFVFAFSSWHAPLNTENSRGWAHFIDGDNNQRRTRTILCRVSQAQ